MWRRKAIAIWCEYGKIPSQPSQSFMILERAASARKKGKWPGMNRLHISSLASFMEMRAGEEAP